MLGLLDATEVVNMITLKQPDVLLVPLEVELELAVVTASGIVDDSHAALVHQIAEVTLHLLGKDTLGSLQDVLRHALLSHFLLERLFEFVVLHEIVVLLEVEHYLVQIYEFTHLSDEALVSRAQEAAEVVPLFDPNVILRVRLICVVFEDLAIDPLFDSEDTHQGMFPQSFLLVMCRLSTALLLANLHDARKHFVKLLNVLVAPIHILEHDVKQRVHNVCPQLHQDGHIQTHCFEVVAIALVENCAGFEGSLFLANFETCLDREVASRDEVHNLASVSLVTKNFDELEQE